MKRLSVHSRLLLLVLCQLTILISYRCGSSAGGTVAGGGSSGGGSSVTIGYFQLHLGTNYAFGDASGYDEAGEHKNLAIDSSGNIFMSGYAGDALGEAHAGSADLAVIKLDANGDTAWIAQLGEVSEDAIGGDTSADGSEVCHSLALDSNDNIFVVGTTTGALAETNAGGFDVYVARISPAGAFLWVSQIGATTEDGLGGNTSASGTDSGKIIAIDDNDNIFIAGTTDANLGEAGAAGVDTFIARLNTSGTYLWLTHLGEVTEDAFNGDTSADGGDEVKALIADSSGNTYITGYTTGSLGEAAANNQDMFFIKTNIDGTIQWVNQIGEVTEDGLSGDTTADGSDFGWALAFDSNGDIIVGGITNANLGEVGAPGEDGVLLKMDSSGNFDWVSQIGEVTEDSLNGDGSAFGTDEILEVVLDTNDNIYFAGLTSGNLGETVAGSFDLFFGKASSDGTFLWLKQIGETTEDSLGGDTSANGWEHVRGMAWHSSGKLVMGGDTQGNLFDTISGVKDLFIFSVDTDGNFAAP